MSGAGAARKRAGAAGGTLVARLFDWNRAARSERQGGAGERPAEDEIAFAIALDAFGQATIRLDGDRSRTLAGAGVLEICGDILGEAGRGAEILLDALEARDPGLAEAIRALTGQGTPFERSIDGPGGTVEVSGATSGGMALIRLQAKPVLGGAPSPPPAETATLRAFVEAQTEPAFVLGADQRVLSANRAWLRAAGVESVEQARSRGQAADPFGIALAVQARNTMESRERVRWVGPSDRRRALSTCAVPLGSGLTVVWSWDATAAHAAAQALARQDAGFRLILDEITDAVAVFDANQMLRSHNPAFAQLWDLEPAWLAERPSHGALLDRLRQKGRLPELADYGRFRAEELARHERLEPSPEVVWRVTGERLLRVRSLPHPNGGLVQLFSDITTEVRLKSQFNHLIQVQQATLDKLTDAVAVFGADGRLKLSNEAFVELWGLPQTMLVGEPTFDDVVERCVVRLHDMHFWTELKGRITDPDPGVRAAMRGEVAAEGRVLAWQSRPLPDGATLVSFADVTDTRRLEGALADRQFALETAERLKRDFISSVSYELRTPLTTILGYAELLDLSEKGLSTAGRGWLSSVRAAASDLARSVEDILTFAEIDAGEMSLNLAETDIDDLLEQLAHRWGPRAAEARIVLELDRNGTTGTIRADGHALARALDHLVDRALRQTQPGGHIRLAARRSAGEVCLEVADDGRGVPFHVQARIFDRFSGEEGSGAGLGMALVKAIVELHGGWVALESEPGAGALVACHLPDGGAGDEATLG